MTSLWSTAGSSVGCRRPDGDRWNLSFPTWRSRRSSSLPAGGSSTCSRSVTRKRPASGCRASRVRLIVIIAATLGTAAAVSVSGLIGFVGIIVPHTIRLIAGPSYRRIIPLSLLFGAGFLILADILARTVLSPGEVPLGVVTAFLGAPFFLVVLRQARRLG